MWMRAGQRLHVPDQLLPSVVKDREELVMEFRHGAAQQMGLAQVLETSGPVRVEQRAEKQLS